MAELISQRVPASIQEYPLTEDSVVFIVGGWMGAHAGYYVDNYDPNMHIFEPQFAMAENLRIMFEDHERVKVHSFGLGSISGLFPMSSVGTNGCSFVHRLPGKDGDESTFEGPHEDGRLMEVSEFLDMAGLKKINLLFINCEGSEFDILPWIVEKGIIKDIDYLMVQFHLHREGAEKMQAIRGMLAKTHDIRDDYEPAWIVWQLRDKPPPFVKPKAPVKRKRKKK